jgi:hypothetical protein
VVKCKLAVQVANSPLCLNDINFPVRVDAECIVRALRALSAVVVVIVDYLFGVAADAPTLQVLAMNITTRPAATAKHDSIRPEFIRLPKPGTSEPWTGLSRSTLNVLVLPCRENKFKPSVRSCTLRRTGRAKGARLINFQSLIEHINSHSEPSFAAEKQSPRVGDSVPADIYVLIFSIRIEQESV